MIEKIIRFSTVNQSTTISQIKINIPTTCPFCHEKMNPNISEKTPYDAKLNQNVAILYQCTSCNKYFASEYDVENFNNSYSAYTSNRLSHTPSIKIEYDLPSELDSFSGQFREIYIQSLTAEEYGLTAISGVGFRKSIEFLVKDFLINFKKHSDSEKIKTMPLSQAIKKIDNEKIINLATASTWIGNDETHYSRKFEDKDVKDMKKFIKALTFYVSSEVVASEAEEMINN